MALECTSDGIYVLDPEGCCVWSNPAAARIFGYTSADAYLGRQMHEVIHHTRADGTPFPESECDGLRKLRAGRDVVQPQELLWRADGTSFWAEVRVNVMVREGEVIGAVTAFRDISERLRLEEQVREAHKLEAVGRLSAGMAHEFNSLLTVMNGHAELLLQQSHLEAAAAERVRGIAQAGARAADLTRQLLGFGCAETPAGEARELDSLLREAEGMLRRIAGAKVEFTLEVASPLPRILAQSGAIEEILTCLVLNAREAMPEGGRLRIRAARADIGADGDTLLLEVRDTGRGMDGATRQRMFEPLFTTKPPSRGTGLGLAVVEQAVRRAGGAIRVESAPGRGTSIQIFWPACG